MGPTEAAERRAQALFESLLTPEELIEWKAERHVTVTGSRGGVYRITTRSSVSDNVVRLDPTTGRRLAVLCAAPNMWPNGRDMLPMWDGWVGQLLALRYNEVGFLRVAITSYPRYW